MQLWELVSPKSTGQASLKFVGQASRLETQQELMLSLETEFLLPWEISVLAQKAFNWLDAAHADF